MGEYWNDQSQPPIVLTCQPTHFHHYIQISSSSFSFLISTSETSYHFMYMYIFLITMYITLSRFYALTESEYYYTCLILFTYLPCYSYI